MRVMDCILNYLFSRDGLTVTGLSLDVIGFVFLYIFAPEKFLDPQATAFFALEDGSREQWRVKQKRRRIIAKGSLVVIILGFVLQACAVIFW